MSPPQTQPQPIEAPPHAPRFPLWLRISLVVFGLLCLAHYNELTHPATVHVLQGWGGGLLSSLSLGKPALITREELERHAAGKGLPEWLALLGRVYDVSSAPQYYGSGGAYSFFTGRDGSRAFVTGQFDEQGLVPELVGLSPEEHLSLDEWLANTYERRYRFVGLLVGHLYDAEGQPTAALREHQQLSEQARQAKTASPGGANSTPPGPKYPKCSSSWSQATGEDFWCPEGAGSVPRQHVLANGEPQGCVCVPVSEALEQQQQQQSHRQSQKQQDGGGGGDDDEDEDHDHSDLGNGERNLGDNGNREGLLPYPGCSMYSTRCRMPALGASATRG